MAVCHKKIIIAKYRMGRNEQQSCMLHTIMGHTYLFNVYSPCDTTIHEYLCECNMILTDIAKCCAENDVSNCIIGGDMNTDLSRVKSGNAISLHKFISEENLSFVLKDKPISIDCLKFISDSRSIYRN